jgi:hypothetical protein
MDFSLWNRAMATGLYRIVIATVLMAQAVGILLLLLDETGQFGPRSFFALLAGTAVGGLVYYMATLIMRMSEAELLTARLQALLALGRR